MAMIRVEPVAVRVRTDWFDERPCAITWGAEELRVRRLSAVRQEAAAYKASVGPRTVFEVDTSRARLALSFEHRSRRWTIEGLDEDRNTA